MLVLTRKKSEMILIGENIVIKVIRTGQGTVKLGIDAPADVRILRGELCEESFSSSSAQQQEEDEESCSLDEVPPQHRRCGPHTATVAV